MNIVERDAATERLRSLVASVLELDPAEVGVDDDFYDDLQAGSLEKVEMTARIEREFGVRLTPEEAVAVQRLSDAVDLLERKLGHTYDLVHRLVAEEHGERIAYVDPDLGDVTYARLRIAAQAYASRLQALDVPVGGNAVLIADDSAATVTAVLGMWWHGCVPVPISPALTVAEVTFIVADCGAALVHLDAS